MQYFVPFVTVLSVVTFVVWLLSVLLGSVSDELLQRYDSSPLLLAFSFGLSVWVSACPCAFGLATPTAILVSKKQHTPFVR